MINKRLIALCDKKPVYQVVVCQWLEMLLNALLIFRVGFQLERLYQQRFSPRDFAITMAVFVGVILLRGWLKGISAQKSHQASSAIKVVLRPMLYEKIHRLGGRYSKEISTAKALQVGTEGVDQLESYFGQYLPQFFYCMLAPLTLFALLAPFDFWAATVLFVCVPLIPVSIVIIQKIAKKLLAKYWGLYTALGDGFLENVQGMTALKIYQADAHYHQEMNKNAEHFRRITMKVLSMQLNSIIVMDTVAYGGSALGGILAVTALANGTLTVGGAVVILLLSAEFFLPMRKLGSFFHIAMNGMAAAETMFALLDMEEPKDGNKPFPNNGNTVAIRNLSFAYAEEKTVLHGIDCKIEKGMTALVGVSGCGKSTLAGILSKREKAYRGSISIGGVELRDICEKSLHSALTYVGSEGYLFKGTVRENLQMGKKNATVGEMQEALEKVQLWAYFQQEKGVDTWLAERGSNLSGGQRQRLHLARALLKASQLYIFDEVTSNVDVESENAIMEVIHELAKEKTVVVISHRLENVEKADKILVLSHGKLVEEGRHGELLLVKKGVYRTLYEEQKALLQG